MMELENILDRQKRIADEINLAIIIIGVLFLGMFLKLTFVMSLMIYPMFSLLIYGILKIRKGFTKKLNEMSLKILNVLFGVACILFGLFLITLIFSYPNIGLNQIIYLLAFPVIIVGIA